jgi:Mimiviridae putative endonuclease 4
MPKKSNIHYFGHHVSIEGGILKQIQNAFNHSVTPNAFQIFIQSPRFIQEKSPSATICKECNDYLNKKNIYLVIHAPYTLNMAKYATPNQKVFNCAIANLKGAHDIGASGAIFHVGKSLDQDINDALDNMENFVHQTIKKIKQEKMNSYFILETGAGQGSEMCCDIEQLGKFFNRFSDDEKKHFKFCVDTCHVFAAGYNLKTKKDVDKFLILWEKQIGWKYVELIHLNDSKKDCCCKVDRHENLKEGYIWKNSDGLNHFVSKMKEKNIPLILETPDLDGSSLTNQLNIIK